MLGRASSAGWHRAGRVRGIYLLFMPWGALPGWREWVQGEMVQEEEGPGRVCWPQSYMHQMAAGRAMGRAGGVPGCVRMGNMCTPKPQ